MYSTRFNQGEGYFILHSTEDGISVEQVDEQELIKRITPDEGGCTYYGKIAGFHEDVPDQDKGFFWSSGGREDPSDKLLIIKGHVIVPKPKEVVKTYTLNETD